MSNNFTYLKVDESSNLSSEPAPSGACCWICLGEGPDEHGKPLVRNCSCRGDSGFSHFQCIVQYAEKKSLQLDKMKIEQDNYMAGGPLFVPWQACPNCLQHYKGNLVIGLADEYLSFTKRTAHYETPIEGVNDSTFPCDPIRYVDALYHKLNVYGIIKSKEGNRIVKDIAKDIISLIGIMKTRPEQVFGPAYSQNSQQIKQFCILNIEAWTLLQLGTSTEKDVAQFGLIEKEEGLKTALKYYEKSREVAKSFPGEGVQHADVHIARVKGILNGEKESLVRNLPFLRSDYKRQPDTRSGAQLAMALFNTFRGVEYNRLMDELLQNSRRVHGADHETTRYLENIAEALVMNTAWLNSDNGEEGIDGKSVYEALRYDVDQLVVRGPLSLQRRRKDEMRTVTVIHDEIIIGSGTPVICNGLQKASHLNGEIGDVRSYDKESGRYEVHFEDESLKPALVRHQNVRIIFELSSIGENKDEDYDDVD